MSKLFQTHAELNVKSKELGFLHWNMVSLKQPLNLLFYENWLKQGYHGNMDYLERHLLQKRDPREIHPDLQSSFVFIHPYFPHPQKNAFSDSSKRIAMYAQGDDYHLWLQDKLKTLIEILKNQYPNHVFLPASDSSPVLERDLAYRSGLGWVGKNTCLIRPKVGSLFFIAEILTSLPCQEEAQLMHDFCGNCNRCIEACPTGALEAPRLLNANKCISYLTIESQEVPAQPLRSQIGDWFFGCDICQTVCPWNQKVFGSKMETVEKRDLTSHSEKYRAELISELREILTLSGKKLQKKFFGSPLMRARPFGLRKNAIIVATNQNLTELMPDIKAWEEDEKLKELVQWSSDQLSQIPIS